MASMSFDPEDVALTVVTFIATSAMSGIATWSLFDISFGDTAFNLAGSSVTIATALAAAAFIATVATNDNTDFASLRDDVDNLDQSYALAVVGSMGLLVAWVFFPEVESFVNSSDLWALGYVSLSVAGQFVTGWIL